MAYSHGVLFQWHNQGSRRPGAKAVKYAPLFFWGGGRTVLESKMLCSGVTND